MDTHEERTWVGMIKRPEQEQQEVHQKSRFQSTTGMNTEKRVDQKINKKKNQKIQQNTTAQQ